jgi:hypothetical protein
MGMNELQTLFLEAFIKASAVPLTITLEEDSEEGYIHKYFHVFNAEESLYLSLDGHISGTTREGPWRVVLHPSGDVDYEGPAPEWVSSLVQSLA